jgi:hypothetical protein
MSLKIKNTDEFISSDFVGHVSIKANKGQWGIEELFT